MVWRVYRCPERMLPITTRFLWEVEVACAESKDVAFGEALWFWAYRSYPAGDVIYIREEVEE